VKLRGRAEAPAIGAEGAQFPSARGANTEAPHGPLQRLLDGDGSIIGELNPGHHSSLRESAGALIDLTKETKVNADVGRLEVVSVVFSAQNGRHTIGVELSLAQ